MSERYTGEGLTVGIDTEGGSCPDCETMARLVTCEDCGTWAWLVDCGHQAQPRPIAPDGSHAYCDDCYQARDEALSG